MTGPEDEQTDIIPALRQEEDTAVDRFPPVGGARHRAAHRPSRGRAVGVAAIIAAAAVVGYGTYTLRPSAPVQRVGVPPAAESAEPTTAEPSSPLLVRPSRTRPDRHRSRPPSPSPQTTTATPSPQPARSSPSPTRSLPDPSPAPTRPSPAPTGTGSTGSPTPTPTDTTTPPEATDG